MLPKVISRGELRWEQSEGQTYVIYPLIRIAQADRRHDGASLSGMLFVRERGGDYVATYPRAEMTWETLSMKVLSLERGGSEASIICQKKARKA